MLSTVVRVCQIAFLVVATGAVGYFLWGQISAERQRDLSPYEIALVDRVVEKVVKDLPRREEARRLLVMPVKGDLDDQVLERVLDRIGATRQEFDVIDSRRHNMKTAERPSDIAAAMAFAEKLRTDARPDGILYLTARRELPRGGVGTTVELTARLVALPKKEDGAVDKAKRLAALLFPDLEKVEVPEDAGERVFASEKIESKASIDWFAPTMQEIPRTVRILVWLVLCGGLPFAMQPIVLEVTRRENNRLNAVMLTGFTAFGAVLAWVLMGVRVGFLGYALALFTGFLAFLWSFYVCDRIDESR